MEELLSQFSIQEILLFIVLFAVAFKGAVQFIDWFTDKIQFWIARSKRVDNVMAELDEVKRKHKKTKIALKTMENDFKDLSATVHNNNGRIDSLIDRVDKAQQQLILLEHSDQEYIKTTIANEHDRAMQQGYIDISILGICEDRYSILTTYGEDKVVTKMMEEMRRLPNTKPENKEDTQKHG